MKKEIEEILVVFENCEQIKIGAKDIKLFKHNKDEILLETIDNGDSEYISTWSENTISPLQRLTEYNDITSIQVHYKDGQVEKINPEWYYENEWYSPDNNKYQINEVIDYKNRRITISKEQYIKTRMNKLNNIITESRSEYNKLFKELMQSKLNNK